MFLAWNEMTYSKRSFTLIISMMFLIAYLIYFLTGLAYGLAQANRSAVDSWHASEVILQEDANNLLARSQLRLSDFKQTDVLQAAPIGQAATSIEEGTDANENITLFGIDPESFVAPKIIEGQTIKNDNEVVVSEKLLNSGIKVGDAITLANDDDKLNVVGVTETTEFSVVPVVYTNLKTWRQVAYGTNGQAPFDDVINAMVVNQSLPESNRPDDTVVVPINTFINDLPGYTAQVLTFVLMIGFLVVIGALVISIFIYILTLQKKSMFGIMKAQGIGNGYISRSVIAQTFLLATIGTLIGLALTLLTAALLPDTVPFMLNTWFLVGVTILLIGVAVLGGLFSVRSISRIDPVTAIG
ncbi:MAG: ABC transporter permease [Bavariicoccus seileri]|uniref:ABC transporter permease n=1 Tax=Bavariicoccus seileri TaxID=549685 RepID=UPI0003B52702|nr:ABC transporter permease [Bavariicoccus seileri]